MKSVVVVITSFWYIAFFICVFPKTNQVNINTHLRFYLLNKYNTDINSMMEEMYDITLKSHPPCVH
jgi:hypothetical protein